MTVGGDIKEEVIVIVVLKWLGERTEVEMTDLVSHGKNGTDERICWMCSSGSEYC